MVLYLREAFVDVEMPFPGLCSSKGLWAFFATLPEHIARTTNEIAQLAKEYSSVPKGDVQFL